MAQRHGPGAGGLDQRERLARELVEVDPLEPIAVEELRTRILERIFGTRDRDRIPHLELGAEDWRAVDELVVDDVVAEEDRIAMVDVVAEGVQGVGQHVVRRQARVLGEIVEQTRRPLACRATRRSVAS